MIVRLALVAALGVLLVAARLLADRRAERIRTERVHHPSLPADLVAGDATWVVFTTPYCATCKPVVEHLRTTQPGAAVLSIDVSERPDLARAFSIRTAPTVLRADGTGQILERHVGADVIARLGGVAAA